ICDFDRHHIAGRIQQLELAIVDKMSRRDVAVYRVAVNLADDDFFVSRGHQNTSFVARRPSSAKPYLRGNGLSAYSNIRKRSPAGSSERRATLLILALSRSTLPRISLHSSQNYNVVIFFVVRSSREMKLTFSLISTYILIPQDFHRLWKSSGRAGSPRYV